MASSEDDRYDELLRRIGRVEILATLAFVGSDADADGETRYLLTRFFRDYYRRGPSFERQGQFPGDEFEFLLDRLSRTRHPRWERIERHLSAVQEKQSEINLGLARQLEEFHGKLGEVSSSVETLSQKNAILSAGTHEWLAIQSLGLDAAEVKISRFVPLRVYLSDTPANAVESVSDAISKLLEAFEFEISDDFPPIRGSWFKKWFVKTRDIATQPEVMERLEKIERAVELKGLGQPQADIDKKQSEAVANLLKAVASIPNAAIQAGSILLVKITSSTGPVVQVRTLTQRELIHLENNQRLLSSPADLLEKLSALCQASDRLKHPEELETRMQIPAKKRKKSGLKPGPIIVPYHPKDDDQRFARDAKPTGSDKHGIVDSNVPGLGLSDTTKDHK